MEINITYKSPEHEAAFLSELQRIPHIVNGCRSFCSSVNFMYFNVCCLLFYNRATPS